MKVKALGMLLLSGNQAKTTLTLEKKCNYVQTVR